MKSPIVPLVTYGGFELLPPGTYVNTTGKVYIKYLKAISPSEATTREEMHRLVRKRILLELKNCPRDAATELTWTERTKSILASILLFTFDAILLYYLRIFLFEKLRLPVTTVIQYSFYITVLITVALYIYFVYVTEMISHFGHFFRLLGGQVENASKSKDQ